VSLANIPSLPKLIDKKVFWIAPDKRKTKSVSDQLH